MKFHGFRTLSSLAVILIVSTAVAAASEPEIEKNREPEGEITTLWPLFDYRSSPTTGYRNLSILGPFFKSEISGSTKKVAFRPFFFTNTVDKSSRTNILYPLASIETEPDSQDSEVLKLYQSHTKTVNGREESSSMLFPFYISGKSEKYGKYTSVFPFYGDIYERFWRDEYHYTMFPLYAKTVKKGTVSTNWLYPFFSSIKGDNESGFGIFPFYGQSSKQGVYEKQYIFWPFYNKEVSGLNTENPSEIISVLPFYSSKSTAQLSSTHIPWPTTGSVRNSKGEIIERDYFWPFWMQAKTEKGETKRYLPFYANSKNSTGNSSKWIAWPFYHEESIDSADFRQEKFSMAYFFYKKSEESWPKTGKSRSGSGLWPLYQWQLDENGESRFTFPAIVETIIINDAINNNLAPLWRIFITKSDSKGNSATSFMWNLFWHERQGSNSAWEISPLFSYRSTGGKQSFKLLKGLFGYNKEAKQTEWSLLWIKF